LDAHLLRASGPAAFAALLERVVRDPAFRAEAGGRMAASIAEHHSGAGWRAALARAEAALAAPGARGCLADGGDRFEDGPVDRAVARFYAHLRNGLPDAVQTAVGGWPYRERMRVLPSLLRAGLPFYRSLLLPQPVSEAMARWTPGLYRFARSLIASRPQA
jgi:hypothetical protein